MKSLLFPRTIASREWQEFQAKGFEIPVAGVIYQASNPAVCGMPLGGVGTGCIDLENNGTLGYSTVFNSLWPRAGPLNMPFLGVSVGRETWVLSTIKLMGAVDAQPNDLYLRTAKNVDDILYFGHYSIADLEYLSDCPLQLALRAWSPFIPGDLDASNTPCCCFELSMHNPTDVALEGTVVCSIPGPYPHEIEGLPIFEHQSVRIDQKQQSRQESVGNPIPEQSRYIGVIVRHSSGVEYSLGVLGMQSALCGGGLGMDGGAWTRIGTGTSQSRTYGRWHDLPEAKGQADAAIMVFYALQPGEDIVIPFIFTWYAPKWNSGGRLDSGGTNFFNFYANRFHSARDIVELVSLQYYSWLSRIIQWQQVLYGEVLLPVWLRDSLINNFHLIAECGVWAQARPPIDSWCKPEDGLYAMNESPRGCPQMECIPCSFYGNFPLVYFFPRLALSTLRAYKAYQFDTGQVPWVFGGCTDPSRTPSYELAMPSRGYGQNPQTALDGTCYVSLVDRLFLCLEAQNRSEPAAANGNDALMPESFALIQEFYESLKQNTIFTMTMRPEAGDGSVVMAPSGENYQDWFESVKLVGIIPHLGFIHLAHLKIMAKIAEMMEDTAFAQQCLQWFDAGANILDTEAWRGDNYYLYIDPDKNKKSQVIFAYQLDGEWIARMHRIDPVLPIENIKATLATLQRTNINSRGACVFNKNDDKEFGVGYWGETGMHVPGTLMLAMLYIYYDEPEFGMELARRAVHDIAIETGSTWDSPILISCTTGLRIYGNDYYQNMMLWTLPAALLKEDVGAPCLPGGLVDRIIHAGKKK